MQMSTEAGAGGRLLKLLAAVGLCHAPVWLLGIFAVMPQPLLSLDVLLALALFARHRPLGAGAMLIAWTLSLLRSVALNYHFHDVSEFVDSFRFAHLLSLSSFVSWPAVLASVLAIGAFAVIFRLVAASRPRAGQVIVLTMVLGVADILNGSASAVGLGRDSAWTSLNLLGTPGYNLMHTELNFLRFGAQPLTPFDPPPRSWSQLGDQARRGSGSTVLILAESLGWPRDAEIRSWLFSQLETAALRVRWDMDVDSEPFYGGTVGGEVRVLCGLRGHYSRLNETNDAGCLPKVFRDHGVAATAMHGFSAKMFDRGEWWPRVGFDRTDFDTSFVERGHRRCPGAFDGVCDHDVLAAAFARATQGRQFVYALTINTHLPLPRVEVSQALAAMCARHSVPRAACQLIEAQSRLLRDIGDQLAAVDQGVDVVMVVGDHSPPFYAAADRDVFSASVVPSLRLRPRPAAPSR